MITMEFPNPIAAIPPGFCIHLSNLSGMTIWRLDKITNLE